jgi:hypothetical protein
MPKGSTFNYERAATVLAEATFADDATVLRRHGLTSRTLQRYRKRLQTDSKLSQLVALKKAALVREWAEELAPAVRDTIRFLQRAATQADPADPNAIHAVAGALKILSEVLLTREVVNARLAGTDRPQHAEVAAVAPTHQHAQA